MNFNPHYNLRDKHAFLGASQNSWLNYDKDKLIQVFMNKLAVERGTKLHALAKNLIDLGVSLPRSKRTLNAYVNDAIGYRMKTEQILYYSDNCFGTADSIIFDEKKKLLRIHDLKTGQTPANMKQLLIYAALFCLEYKYKPAEIKIELRIYQGDDVIIFEPEVDDVVPIMDKIITFDNYIKNLNTEGFINA